MANNDPVSVSDITLPERILSPDETVFDVLVGNLKNDTFPLLLVTDRRVIVTMDRMVRGWRILSQAPLAEIVSVEVSKGLLAEKVRISLRQGKPITLKSSRGQQVRRVVALLQGIIGNGQR